MDLKRLVSSINKTWDDSIIDRLTAYVRIPNKSPMFDPKWKANGHMDAGGEADGGLVPGAAAARGPRRSARGARSHAAAAGGHPRRAR